MDSRSVRRSVDWNMLTPLLSQKNMVAPFAGAWIEIVWCKGMLGEKHCRSVRRSVDWNLWVLQHCIRPIKSLRSPERGLKLSCGRHKGRVWEVAPFAGAWIEISDVRTFKWDFESLRSPERGLKYKYLKLSYISISSLRSPERGLKYHYWWKSLLTLRRSVRRSVDWNVHL